MVELSNTMSKYCQKKENQNQDEQKQIVDQCQLGVSVFTKSGLKRGTRTHKYENNCTFSDIGKMAAKPALIGQSF